LHGRLAFGSLAAHRNASMKVLKAELRGRLQALMT
jgi:hypothetical protein